MDFIYYNTNKLDIPLDESILISSSIDTQKYIVSNSDSIDSYIKAYEVDYYLNNTQDTLADQIKNVKLLYDIKGLVFDLSRQKEQTKQIQNKILIVASESIITRFMMANSDNGFDFYAMDYSVIDKIVGDIGNLAVHIKDKSTPLYVDQIVIFDRQKEYILSGVIYASSDDLVKASKKIVDNKEYKYYQSISYNNATCEYHDRYIHICTKCVDVCPSSTIGIDEASHTLSFTHTNCIACGKCASVCPSGAIEYTKVTTDAIDAISKLLKDKSILITTNKDLKSMSNIHLSTGIIPIAFDSINFFDESMLMTLLQQSGKQITIYSQKISQPLKDSITLINDIYTKTIGISPIQYIDDIQNISLQDISVYQDISNTNKAKRKVFASRVMALIDNDYGNIATPDNLVYSSLSVDSAKCTLCLSCVGVCKAGAFSNNQKELSLNINQSLCTSCGYCTAVCPEKCITITPNNLMLKNSYFSSQEVARDELFCCVECGKEYATNKSIQKVASMMSAYFFGDKLKLKTLYCCADCKAKVMLVDYINKDKNNG